MRDKYFKAVLTNIDDNLNIPIVCKIYNFNSLYFAQEIVTGAVFPIIYSNNLIAIDKETNIPIRENFLSELSLVLPKCLMQNHRRNIEEKDFFDIRTHAFEEERYRKFIELTVRLDEYSIDNVKKGYDYIKLNDFGFDPKKYISEMDNDYEYKKAIWQAKINNDKIFENIGYFIAKARQEDANMKGIHTEISTGSHLKENTYKPNIDVSKISKYGYDLANKDEFVELIERDEEIKQIIKSACIKNSSILLIGESGSGKTAIVEEIARLTRTDNKFLNGKTIFSLNSNSLVSGAMYRGSFEKNLEEVINFCKNHKKEIILFIDEIHTLKGLGTTHEFANDAMNILKPFISDGTITIIGATTKAEYEKYLTEDEAFLRRFEKININILDKEKIVDILINFNKKLEEKYNIKFNTDSETLREIFNLIVELTDTKHQRIVGDIAITNPTLCKYLLEDAYAECIYDGKEEVTIEELAKAIRNCDKVSPSKKEELADLILDEYKDISFEDNDTIKKDNEIIKLSFN